MDEELKVPNASDEVEVKASKNRHAKRKAQKIEDIKKLCDDPRFLRFIKEMLRFTNTLGISYSDNKGWSTFQEGCRNVGTHYLELIREHRPDKLSDILALLPEDK